MTCGCLFEYEETMSGSGGDVRGGSIGSSLWVFEVPIASEGICKGLMDWGSPCVCALGNRWLLDFEAKNAGVLRCLRVTTSGSSLLSWLLESIGLVFEPFCSVRACGDGSSIGGWSRIVEGHGVGVAASGLSHSSPLNSHETEPKTLTDSSHLRKSMTCGCLFEYEETMGGSGSDMRGGSIGSILWVFKVPVASEVVLRFNDGLNGDGVILSGFV
ncbi:hypothetical protein Droror1_Dr00012017 [Drosera rotundifolia]